MTTENEYYKLAWIPGIRSELLKDGIWSFTWDCDLIAVISHGQPQERILKEILKEHNICSLNKVKIEITDFLPTEKF